MKKVLLVSNRVMHYRVSLYNYFARQFQMNGWELIVRCNEVEAQNPHKIQFDFKAMPFEFLAYRREIKRLNPDAVILFLHLKDKIIWPLIHWLRLARIPVIYWNKGVNLERPSDVVRNQFFYYVHSFSDRLILYSRNEIRHIQEKNRHKVFVANNTLNFEDFPEILQTKEDIKQEFDLPFDRVVLSVGRMGSLGGRKKVEHLVEVFKNLELPGAGLVIVGSGVTEDLMARTNQRNTRYLGEVHDPDSILISKLFKAADVFSIPGQLGLGLNQAMYWQLPVVTEGGFQPPEIQYLVDGRNGYVVGEDDINALKGRLIDLLTNDELRLRLGQNARNDILEHASPFGMYKGFQDCLESLGIRD